MTYCLNDVLNVTKPATSLSCPTGLESNNLQTEVSLRNQKTKNGRVSDLNGGYAARYVHAGTRCGLGKQRAVDAGCCGRVQAVCPDFVIEVRSESDSLKELQARMEKWLENGVRLGWLVDPQERKTTIYRPDSEIETKPFSETLSGEDVLVGFTMNMKEALTY